MPRFDHAIAVGFMAALATPLVLDVLAWDAGWELPGMRRMTEVARVQPDEWWNGVATQKAEQTLVGGSLLLRFLVPHYNAAWYRATGRTAPAARVDDDGWIFASERTRPLPPARYDALIPMVTERVRAEVDEVEARGLRVAIAVVPDRARMHPDHAYPGGVLPRDKAEYLPRLVGSLRDAQLTVIDLTPALRQLAASGVEPFYRADHHWTSEGALAGATSLAEQLQAADLVPRCAAPDYQPFVLTWSEEPEATSLLRKLGLPAKGELELRWTRPYRRARAQKRGTWEPRQAPVVYVTTSYGRWNAPEMVSNALRCPVSRALRDGNSFTNKATLLARIERHSDIEHARLVVWELLEYDLYSAAGVPLGQDS